MTQRFNLSTVVVLRHEDSIDRFESINVCFKIKDPNPFRENSITHYKKLAYDDESETNKKYFHYFSEVCSHIIMIINKTLQT